MSTTIPSVTQAVCIIVQSVQMIECVENGKLRIFVNVDPFSKKFQTASSDRPSLNGIQFGYIPKQVRVYVWLQCEMNLLRTHRSILKIVDLVTGPLKKSDLRRCGKSLCLALHVLHLSAQKQPTP